ncbi:MAG: hypothetical protein NTY41_01370 [Proteobacteria bacterium]|nr:hypothetical protein [Pseudomonadota bacterium]
MKKNILVVAKNNKEEALRVAVGLVLLSDIVKLVVLGELDDTTAVAEQREVLEFADVPCELLQDSVNQTSRLAQEMASANLVYVI